MKLILIFSIFLFAGASSANTNNKCFRNTEKCSAKSNTFLGNEYSSNAIFVGFDFNYHVNNLKFIEELFVIAGESKTFPPINLLIPKSFKYFKNLSREKILTIKRPDNIKTGLLYDELKKLVNLYKSKIAINLIQTQDETTLWAQDLFELHYSNNNFQLLNFRKKYSYDYGKILKKECNVSPVEHNLPVTPINLKDRLYEDGGNFEMVGDVTVIGNNMPSAYKNYFRKNNPNVFELKVDWLDVGHVDELIQVIPQDSKTKCGSIALVYSSPKLGLQLSGSLEKKNRKRDKVCGVDGQSKATLLRRLKGCNNFNQYNLKLDEKINSEVARLSNFLKNTSNCKKKVKTIPMPTLFYNDFNLPRQKKGLSQNKARPLVPNLVNLTIIEKLVLLPKQSLKSFMNYASKEFSSLTLKPKFMSVGFLHSSNGSVHCALNVVRGCLKNK